MAKREVREFWNAKSCGEVYAFGKEEREFYDNLIRTRYELEPYIATFAQFELGKSKDVLEIGVGMGADHLSWARHQPRSLTGIDLTPRAIEHTKRMLLLHRVTSELSEADAESLPFQNNSFDLVYSWGVLHHSPNTQLAIDEVYRVLRKGGQARIMIYHRFSITGYLLWLRYALLVGKPLTSLDEIYAKFLESPGTKAYSIEEAKQLFVQFEQVKLETQLSFGDLLQGEVGQRHRGWLLSIAKKKWPRNLIRKFFHRHGLMLLVVATK